MVATALLPVHRPVAHCQYTAPSKAACPTPATTGRLIRYGRVIKVGRERMAYALVFDFRNQPTTRLQSEKPARVEHVPVAGGYTFWTSYM